MTGNVIEERMHDTLTGIHDKDQSFVIRAMNTCNRTTKYDKGEECKTRERNA